MGNLYMKNKNGEYIPVSFEEVVDKSWDNKLILVTMGSPQNMASDLDCRELLESFQDADALRALNGASFLIVEKPIKFENLGPNNVNWEYMMIEESKDE